MRLSTEAMWDVAHASVRRIPVITVVDRACVVEEARCKLTWLASCVRRILRQLILAVAEERRVGGVREVLGRFDVGGR